MFQIESHDMPDFRYRVLLLNAPRHSTVIISKSAAEGLPYMTHVTREFDSREAAENAFNKQRHLLTILAKLHGDNYLITENTDIVPQQLSLEIAA